MHPTAASSRTRRCTKQEILRHPAQIQHGGGDRAGGFGDIIRGRDRAIRIELQAVEAEQRGGEMAVDGKAGCRDRACSERAAIDGDECRLQPAFVAAHEFDYRQQVVRERDRLRRLRVRVSRHQGQRCAPARPSAAHVAPRSDGARFRGFGAQTNAVERDVDIVAAARRVHGAGVLRRRVARALFDVRKTGPRNGRRKEHWTARRDRAGPAPTQTARRDGETIPCRASISVWA